MQGLSFPEAVEQLARRAGIPLPESSSSKKYNDNKDKSKKQQMHKVNAFAADLYHKFLLSLDPKDPRSQYVSKRGLSDDIIKTFKIGLAPDSWEALTQELVKKQAPLDLSSQLGLIRKKEAGGYYDIFRNRLMFPIISHLGDCIGFGGRTLGDDNAKYINSPESDIFHKGKIFFGLNETAKYIRTADQAIVVEGYMDFMALYSAGVQNVVAVLGTALTPYHAKLIKRFTKNILVLFDGDSSGQTAAERSLPILLAEGLFPKYVGIPDSLDPDDYIKKLGVERFKKLIDGAQDLFLSIFQQNLQDYHGQPSDKVLVVNKMSESLNAITDNSLKRLYLEEIADTLQQKPEWVLSVLRSAGESKPAPKVKLAATKVSSVNSANSSSPLTFFDDPSVSRRGENKEGGKFQLQKAIKAEIYLINLFLFKEHFLKSWLENPERQQYLSQEVRAFVDKLVQIYRQNPNNFDKLTALLANEVEPEGVISRHLDTSWEQMDEGSLEKLFNDCLKKVQELDLKTKQRTLRDKLRSPDPQERQKHLEQFMNIQRTRQSLNNNNKSK